MRLLSFSSSLKTQCLFLNYEPCIVRPTFIDLNDVQLNYYPFMIGWDKCSGSYNVLSPKISVPKETKDIKVKPFNTITNKNEAKAMTEHVSCDCNANSIVQYYVIQVKNEIIKHANVNVKVIVDTKKIIVGILLHVFVWIVSI